MGCGLDRRGTIGRTRLHAPACLCDKSGFDYGRLLAAHLCGYIYVLGQADTHSRVLGMGPLRCLLATGWAAGARVSDPLSGAERVEERAQPARVVQTITAAT